MLMYPPTPADGAVPLRTIKFQSTGRQVHPDPETGALREPFLQAEIDELIADGWRVGKTHDIDDLRKAVHSEAMRSGLATPRTVEKITSAELRRRAISTELRHFSKTFAESASATSGLTYYDQEGRARRAVIRRVSMLAPRSGIFEGPSGKAYVADYEGEEVPDVIVGDVEALRRQGFRLFEPDMAFVNQS